MLASVPPVCGRCHKAGIGVLSPKPSELLRSGQLPIPDDQRKTLANLPRDFAKIRGAYDTIEDIVTNERFAPALDELYDDEQLRHSLSSDSARQYFNARGVEIPDEVTIDFDPGNWHYALEITLFTDSGTYCIGVAIDSTAGLYNPC
jgi:hypothetical protein